MDKTFIYALAQWCSCIEPTLVFVTRPTSTHQRVRWPGLYRKLIGFLRIVVWHIRVSTCLLEVTWLECDLFAYIHYVLSSAFYKYGHVISVFLFMDLSQTILAEVKLRSILLPKIHNTHIAWHHRSIFSILYIKCLWLKPIGVWIHILLDSP